MFDDLIGANAAYADRFTLAGLQPGAARRLAVVTCIDSRIEPLAMLGLAPGDAKIIRNAGGRVTNDVLRSLAIASNLLAVNRIAVIHHTSCAMISSDADIDRDIAVAAGRPAAGRRWRAITDPDADLAADVAAIRDCDLVTAEHVAGWRYDIATGLVTVVVP
jgi:carbonic anhydrase